MTKEKKTHVCPWWLGYFLLGPVRRSVHDPHTILSPYIREGMRVLEIGPGMGFFSLTLAQLVGERGGVICVDIQEKMLRRLRRRGEKKGLGKRITLVRASEDSLNIQQFQGAVDFTLVFAVVHEVPDQSRLFTEIHRSMRPGALLLLSEPRGHVTQEEFDRSLATARAAGFKLESHLEIKRTISSLLSG